MSQVNVEKRAERDEFYRNLKREWALMWLERFDDKVRAEGVTVRDYSLLLMEKGCVIFATRDTKIPSFHEILDYWASRGYVYAPNPNVGGWGKFIRTCLRGQTGKRAERYNPENGKVKPQLKKGGRGWLHIE